jgi:Domain of unknown function (DUF4150)
MSVPRELSRDTGRGILISKVPDVCKSPVCPIPYTIVAYQSDDANTAPTVRMTGERAHKQTSIITQCSGDEPGVGLGVKSGTVKSVCHRKTHSSHVRIEGQWATRHLDEWWMNNRNTFGVLYFIEDQKLYEAAPVMAWKLEGHPQLEPLGEGDLESPALAQISDLTSQMSATQTADDDAPRQMTGGAGSEGAWMSGQQYAQMRPAPRRTPYSPGSGFPNQYVPPQRRIQPRHRYNPNQYRLPPGRRPKPEELAPPNAPMVNQPDFFYDSMVPYKNGVYTVPSGVPGLPAGPLVPRVNEGPLVYDPVFFDSEGNSHSIAEVRRAWDKYNEKICRPVPPPLPEPAFNEDLERITRRKNDPCKTGRYGSLKCGAGEQAHHIVPDYTLRYGTRAEGISGTKRIPGLPSFRDGPAICLVGHAASAGDEHGIAHKADADVAAMGGARGTAPIAKITARSVRAAIAARPECELEIIAATAAQPSLLGDTLGRTTIQPPGDWPPGSGSTP